jgi:glyoxylase-like metal-dependent hydrolase (beta-lactamase superfamily II)
VLSERVRTVLGLNPTPSTGAGTNTYLVGRRAPILIDTGAGVAAYAEALRAALAEWGLGPIGRILLTHGHADHVGGLGQAAALAPGAPVMRWAPPEAAPSDGTAPVRDGDLIGGDDCTLAALHTPGHAADHLCFYLREERALFSGDLIAGQGTVVIPLQGGDLGHYLGSLERLLGLDLGRIYPGHGPVIADGPAKVREYLDHRRMRDRQILEALRAGITDVSAIVERIYAEVPPELHRLARQSVLQHLRKLEREGVVAAADPAGQRFLLS